MTLAQRALAIAVLELASLLAAIAYGHHRYTQGLAAGRAAQLAEQAKADRAGADQAQQAITASAQAGNALSLQIQTQLPAIEVASHDTAQRIRTIYLAAPALAGGADCARPPGVQEQLDAGAITLEEAAVSPHRNLVTRALGIERQVELEINEHVAEPGDLFLLCSDGLSEMVSDAQIFTLLLQDNSLPEKSTLLVAAANKNGGRDNISVVLALAGSASTSL